MWIYNGITYMCNPEDILHRLRDYARANGYDILKDIKPTSNAIMFTCPWHKDGQERKPSCGLIINQKSKDSLPVGSVHCFTCSHVSNLEELVSNCLGINDKGLYGSKWLAANFESVEISSRQEIDLSNLLARNNEIKLNNNYISEEELDNYRYIHPYMYQRHLSDRTIEIFDVGYDKHFQLGNRIFECITFPIRDINGNCLFIARRAIYEKIYNYPNSVIKPLYGLYELNRYAPSNLNEIYICEGILNCISVWEAGKYAIALNGTGSSTQIEELLKLKYRKIVLALDPDDAGIKGCKKIYKKLKNSKIITRLKIPPGKDINDLTKEEFLNLEEVLMNENINF